MPTSVPLVHPATAAKWEAKHAVRSDKRFPNLDLVRLQSWYFGGVPGRLLDYGFGCGVNLLFLLECGHTVTGVEVAPSAKRNVEEKLRLRPDLASRATLTILAHNADHLPFADASFAYVVCVSVLSLLGSRDAVDAILREFSRVLAPDGKAILDVNGPQSDFARNAVRIGDDVYETRGEAGEASHRSYCPRDADAFASLVVPHLTVDDVGYSSHKLLHSEIQEFIICARKASRAVA